ncbi:uncharacterized protein BP5553_01553 [Venustampulla echinocandica]|uniref:Uncharacterized protein n=1 Tax=Venustampulla echinocandica TaxID=2656787 RepID=A0A370U1C9_9HELO|nr:uncharacterized protein BP5553_01553 [Venustampulla echinocandica]RDL41574.1 hypothetical protein BP5553_01553 [Venustampulla echinocandica]
MPPNGKSNGRFQLPQLAPVNFSLTDGTDIPPPPDSPVEEKPRPATHLAIPPSTTTTTITTNGPLGVSTNVLAVGSKRGRSDDPPLSPASTRRPSSIRRFLSKKSLNANFVDGANRSQEDLATIGRPDSRASVMTDVNKKRSRSWFRRLSGSNLGRSNSIAVSKPLPAEKKGPPPPKLPELNQFKAQIPEGDEGSLGAEDMFKNIK